MKYKIRESENVKDEKYIETDKYISFILIKVEWIETGFDSEGRIMTTITVDKPFKIKETNTAIQIHNRR